MSRDQRPEDVKLARTLLGTDRFVTKVNAATQDLQACLRQAPHPIPTSSLIQLARERQGRQLRVNQHDLSPGMRARSAGAAKALDSVLRKLEDTIYGSALWEMEKKGVISLQSGKWQQVMPGGNRQPRHRQRRRLAAQPA